MKAQVINLPVNNSTPSYDMINRNWHDLTKKDDQEISEKLKRVMNIVKYLISSKDYKKFTYPYFIKILRRSQDQVKRYFNEFEETGLGEIKFHKKLLRENGATQWRCLDIKLTEKGVAELGLENRITPHTHTAYSHRTHAACYIDNNTDKKTNINKSNRSDQISFDSVEVFDSQPELQTLPKPPSVIQQENVAITEEVRDNQPLQTEEFSKDYLEFCAKAGIKPRKEPPKVVFKEAEEPISVRKTETNTYPIRRNRELDKPLSALLPLSDDVILAGIKQTGREDLNVGKARGIVDYIAEKYPDKLIYGGRESTLIKYLGIVLKHEHAEVEYNSYRGKKNETDALMEYAYKRAEQIRNHGLEGLYHAY